MRKKAFIAFLILAFFVGSIGFADENGRERKEGTHFTDKAREYSEGEITLLPDFSFSNAIRENITAHGTAFLVEFLFTLPALPDEYASLDAVADLLLDIETLEGIEYWSGGRDRMYPYIRKSCRVESIGSKDPLPVPEPMTPGGPVDFIQYQKDSSFGSNWYDVSVESGEDAILMKTVNLTELKAFTKKTADAGGVLLQMAVIPREEDALMYCAVAMKEFPPIGWSQGGVAGSFNNRISALEAWFADRVYGLE